MRRVAAWLLLIGMLALALSGCAKQESHVDIVEPSESLYVSDYAGILSEETEQRIVNQSLSLKQQCGGEIAVVTIDFLTGGLDAEEYAYELINQWGVGDATRNNGVVLLLVPGEGKGWITAGSGISQELSAGKLESILNQWLWDDFDAGEYDRAVRNTVDAVVDWFEMKYGIFVSAASSNVQPQYFGGGVAEAPARGALFSYALPALFMLLVLVLLLLNVSARVSRGGRVGFGGIFFLPRFRGPRPPHMGPRPPHRGPRPPFGGGFGGGGFRGGGFGGGGGRGGGAGRR